jgi:glycine betaine/proline transport system permease protein
MDEIFNLSFIPKIPWGAWGKVFFTFFTANFDWFFRGISKGMGYALDNLVLFLLSVPPLFVIIALAAAAYFAKRSWKLSLGVFLGFAFMLNQGEWKETMQTLVLVSASTFAAVAIGVPTGIYAAHRPKVWRVLSPLLDLMQTMPTYVYLIPALILFGLGAPSGLIVTVIFAAPAAIRMTHLGITSVPKAMVEAGEAFGANKSQLLWKVELPAALPTVMAGVTECIMLSLSMVVIAGLIGANGLGSQVVRGLNQFNIPLGVEAGTCIVLLALMLHRATHIEHGASH